MLQGTFETLALPELLGLLGSARKTGALRLEAGPVSGVVYLEDGNCRAVETPEHVGRAVDTPALLSRLVDVCFALTRQESGAFRFVSDEAAPWRSEEPVELSDALVEVDRLLKQWREILEVIPSLDCRPRMLEQLEGDEVVIDRAHWALLVAIDGRRSVRDLVQSSARPVLEVCHALLELVEGGAVGILDPVEPTAAPSAPATPAVATPAAPSAPTPAPAPVQPESVQIAAPQAAQAGPAAPAAPAPVRPQPAPAAAARVESAPAPKPEATSAPAPARSGADGTSAEPERVPVPAQAQEPPEAAEESGDSPDKGAFLRLFSGLRDS